MDSLIGLGFLAFMGLGLLLIIRPWAFWRFAGLVMRTGYRVLSMSLPPEDQLAPHLRLALLRRRPQDAVGGEIEEWRRLQAWARVVGAWMFLFFLMIFVLGFVDLLRGA